MNAQMKPRPQFLSKGNVRQKNFREKVEIFTLVKPYFLPQK